MATNTNLLIEDIKHRMEWVKQVLAEFCPLAEDTSKELDEIRDLAVKASTSDSSSTRLTTEQGLDQAYEQTKLLLESSAARHAPTVIQTHLGSGDGPARSADSLCAVNPAPYAAQAGISNGKTITITSGGSAEPLKITDEMLSEMEFSRLRKEEEKLVSFFRSKEGDQLGRAGDHDNLSPVDTAIRAMKELSRAREQIAEWQQKYGGLLQRLNPSIEYVEGTPVGYGEDEIDRLWSRVERAEQQLAEAHKAAAEIDRDGEDAPHSPAIGLAAWIRARYEIEKAALDALAVQRKD